MDEETLVSKLGEAVKCQFGDDQKRIAHAHSVLAWARELLGEEGGEASVVLAAALLHDIGIQDAERRHGSSAGHYQEIEGPPIARNIMERLGLDQCVVEHVCQIVANHHSAKDIDTREFRILWDADWLVNLPEEYPDRSPDDLRRLIERIFKTPSGRARALQAYVKETTANGP